jgi:hypothetical protein
MTVNGGLAQPASVAPGVVVPRRPAAAASRSRAAGDRQYAVLVIGLVTAARVARDRRTLQYALVGGIALAAAAGMAREGNARSLARLSEWNKRQTQRLVRTAKEL